MSQITTANITFQDNGTPVSCQFDDIYYSQQDGMAESDYVFFQQNRVAERWQSWHKNHFSIAETGFGTGLNFLISWAHFRKFRQQHPVHNLRRLHFLSFEKYPLAPKDLEQALASWPELAPLCEQLTLRYPHARSGYHRIELDNGQVVLDLWFGDVNHGLQQMVNYQQGLIDCWYLDGFAPSKNADMWTDNLFSQMARLSAQGCTLSTFTAAGFVRRGLIKAGFDMSKSKGFAHKREMLTGTRQDQIPAGKHNQNYWQWPDLAKQPERVAIIGAGLAAANMAWALAKRGINIDLYSAGEQLADGASGNAQGGFYPALQGDFSLTAEFQATAFDFARQTYDDLLASGYPFVHDFCGVTQVAFTEQLKKRYRNLANSHIWPETLVNWQDERALSALSGVETGAPGLHYPKGGWINPPSLCQALIDAAQASADVKMISQAKITELLPTDQGWQIGYAETNNPNMQRQQATHLVLCNGADLCFAELDHLPLSPVRGQVTQLKSQPSLAQLKTVVCYKGYITPAHSGLHCTGASFVKDDLNRDVRDDEHRHNLELLEKCFAQQEWWHDLEVVGGRASQRAASPDHMPMLGPVYDHEQQREDYARLVHGDKRFPYPVQKVTPGLYLLNGLGSRGLTSAPLCAEIIASYMSQQPIPVSLRSQTNLMTNRFLLRQIQRSQHSKTKNVNKPND